MKILNDLTLKHLRLNKKRTIVTIIGITLATSLMVGIGLLLSSFMESSKQQVISENGNYHALFKELSFKEKEELEQNVFFKNTYNYGTVGFAKIETANKYKPYLFIASAEDPFFNTEQLIEGRYPLNENEIVLPYHLKENGLKENIEIGSKITLDIGYRIIDNEPSYNNDIGFNSYFDKFGNEKIIEEFRSQYQKTYEVVGWIKRSNKENYSAPGYMAYTTKENNIQNYMLYGTYKNVSKSIQQTKEICLQLENQNCETNDALLRYYGVNKYQNINQTLTITFCIILSLLSIGAIIVIYNSFAISAMERKKSFGLYSSLGATPKQIKYTVFFEAFLVGIIGILLGTLGAFLGIYIVIKILDALIGNSYSIHLIFSASFLFVLIPICFMLLVIFIAAYIPAHRSSKISAIELIRENNDIKIPRKKVKIPHWIEKIFGVEATIALKNMKRNKRRYRIPLISLFISIVLFISFSTYLQIGINVLDINDIPAYDVYANIYDENLISTVRELDAVKESYIIKNDIYQLKEVKKSEVEKNYFNYIHGEKDDLLDINIIVVEDEVLKNIQQELKVSENKAIFYNQATYTIYQNENRKTYQTKVLKDLKEINLCNDKEECEKISTHLTNKATKTINYILLNKGLPNLIISKSMASKIKFAEDEYTIALLFSKTNYNDILKEMEKQFNENSKIYYYSPKEELKTMQNTVLAMKILLYGFISLVALTGITSIFNTIYTNIHLRRKEFAMLRSIGLSPKGFNRMLFFESLFFGMKSLLYSLPVSFGIICLINMSLKDTFYFSNLTIPWLSIIACIFSVFFLVLIMMLYSASKIKKENILNFLKDENI